MDIKKMTRANHNHWHGLKEKHPDAVILLRWDDTYCTFEDDAEVLCDVCGCQQLIWDGVSAAGFPHNALDINLPKLVRSGRRVAICDILESPKPVSQQAHTMRRKKAIQLDLFA